MYLILGNTDMEHNNYESAIRSFDLARVRIPRFGNQPLLVVSLVSHLTDRLLHVKPTDGL